MKDENSFTGLRSIIWPIHFIELKKLLPLFIMQFFLNFNYSALRNLKDTVLIMSAGSGAEVIPFVKVWALLPMAILMTYIYGKLINRFPRETVFNIFIVTFILYFFLFALIIYPRLDYFRPVIIVNFLKTILPASTAPFIAMVDNWPCALFYSMAELWTAIITSVLFWGMANEITLLSQAKRFYGVLNLASAFSAFFAGQAALTLSSYPIPLPFLNLQSQWHLSFVNILIMVSATSVVCVASLRYLSAKVISDPVQCPQEKVELNKEKKEEKKKLFSLKDSITHLKQSPYLAYLAFIVMAYNFCISLTELVWKSKLKLAYTDPLDFNNYLNNHISMLGLTSAVFAIFIPKIVSKLGWTVLALITPVILLIFSALFFGGQLLSPMVLESILSPFNISAMSFVVFLGARNNMISKAAKYSVFDASKEMAYLPLPKSVRITGKAAIDGVGSRFGKSGSSLIQQSLLIIFGSVSASLPWIGLTLMIVLGLWIYSVVNIGREFNRIENEDKSMADNHEAAAQIISDVSIESESIPDSAAAMTKNSALGQTIQQVRARNSKSYAKA